MPSQNTACVFGINLVSLSYGGVGCAIDIGLNPKKPPNNHNAGELLIVALIGNRLGYNRSGN
jgi:hypothetical protein